jgi:hypothetical protein
MALIPEALHGRVNSVFRLLAFGIQPLGMAATGLLLQRFAPLPTIGVLFLLLLVLTVATALSPAVRRADRISAIS